MKQKVKLGRSLKPATNKTNTNFKSQKINVPLQTLKKDFLNLNSLTLTKDVLKDILVHKETLDENQIWNFLLQSLYSKSQKRIILKNSWNEIIGKLQVSPFINLITTHLNCALCHIDQDIRLDSLELLKHLHPLPPLIADNVLQNLLEMLDQKNANARLKVLSQILMILQSGMLPTVFITSQPDVEMVDKEMQKVACSNFLNFNSQKVDSKHNKESRDFKIQDKSLPFLVNYWIESMVVLEKEIIEVSSDLKVLQEILKIMIILAKKGSGEDLISLRKSMEKYFAQAFPFGIEKVKKESEAILNEMNWDYCLLVTGFPCNNQHEAQLLGPVVEYILGFLKGFSGTVISADRIDGIFPVIWEILNNTFISKRVDILDRLINFKVVDRSNSIFKKKFEFIAFVIKEVDEKRLDLDLKRDDQIILEIKKWIYYLPRKIWELKLNNMELTQKIIDFLVYIFQHNILDICYDQIGVENIQLSLVPLFHVVAPKGDIYGPFNSYSWENQQHLLNLLFYLPEIHQKLLIAIVACLTVFSANGETVSHFVDIIYDRQLRCNFALEKHLYASICTTLLFGYSSKEFKELQNQLSPSKGFYDIDECLQVKQKVSGMLKRSLITKEEYLKERFYIVKRIFYAFSPFLDELPSIMDGFAASTLALDSGLCFFLALSNIECPIIETKNHIKSMIQSIIKCEELMVALILLIKQNILSQENPGKFDQYLFLNSRSAESSL